MKIYSLCFIVLLNTVATAQTTVSNRWADSVYNSLSEDERIAQLMVVRLSSIDSKTKIVTFFEDKVTELIKQYNIGSICLFQGGPVKQALLLNKLQALAKTPVLICMDAENGVGMRIIDSVLPLPRQMMLGAVQDTSIIYQYGKIVAEQCKRLGIQVNYAPVVDVNNNANNPVINDRSFGEDKYKVAQYGILYMKGMQDAGVMACAKHFPGHGDVAVDSHLDLPVINKTIPELDSLELYPFKKIFQAGIGSVMIAHLYIPAIDSTANTATSISKNAVTELMRNRLGYQGLTFTDALEMQGVKKYFPDGEAAVQSIIAGNDMLCLPEDVPTAIKKIKEAIKNKRISWADIEMHCKKVLSAKYQYGLSKWLPIDTANLADDLNSQVDIIKRRVAENALTVLRRSDNSFLPIPAGAAGSTAYLGIGISGDNAFARRMKSDYNAAVYYFNYLKDSNAAASLLNELKNHYKKIIIGIHNYNRAPANNFGISKASVELVKQLQEQTRSITFVFGNPYAIKNWCAVKNLVACYEDDSIVQNTALDFIQGKTGAKGTLPVTVCEQYHFGQGISIPALNYSPWKDKLNAIDSIAGDAISKAAMPGCVILIAKDGKIAYHKAFGKLSYDSIERTSVETAYDMASVTKICATTLAVMKLYEQGKIELHKKLGDYLISVKGTNKENLSIKNILLHQAGLSPFIPFYKETIDSAGMPVSKLYATARNDSFSIAVTKNLFLRNDWEDTIYRRILLSPLTEAGKYVYSDNDFIFLGKIVEAVSGMSLDKYVKKEFYQPLALTTAGFKPAEYMPVDKIAPTEKENVFRKQLIHGTVHDPGAAMMGGVAGHAGLFSDAYDMAVIMQMLLNGGSFNGKRYLQKETISLFTSYQSSVSRRGLGFDKPEKDNAIKKEPYPCLSASGAAFGHTGFTGTCVWADAEYNLVYIFLSNRVSPDATNNKLMNMNIRSQIQEAAYKALANEQ